MATPADNKGKAPIVVSASSAAAASKPASAAEKTATVANSIVAEAIKNIATTLGYTLPNAEDQKSTLQLFTMALEAVEKRVRQEANQQNAATAALLTSENNRLHTEISSLKGENRSLLLQSKAMHQAAQSAASPLSPAQNAVSASSSENDALRKENTSLKDAQRSLLSQLGPVHTAAQSAASQLPAHVAYNPSQTAALCAPISSDIRDIRTDLLSLERSIIALRNENESLKKAGSHGQGSSAASQGKLSDADRARLREEIDRKVRAELYGHFSKAAEIDTQRARQELNTQNVKILAAERVKLSTEIEKKLRAELTTQNQKTLAEEREKMRTAQSQQSAKQNPPSAASTSLQRAEIEKQVRAELVALNQKTLDAERAAMRIQIQKELHGQPTAQNPSPATAAAAPAIAGGAFVQKSIVSAAADPVNSAASANQKMDDPAAVEKRMIRKGPAPVRIYAVPQYNHVAGNNRVSSAVLQPRDE